MSQQDIVELEATIQDLEGMVRLGQSVDKLLSNREWKKVVENEYLREEAIRLVNLKADPNWQSPEAQTKLDRDIHAIGAFTQFIALLKHKATSAKEALDECEDLRAEYEEGAE